MGKIVLKIEQLKYISNSTGEYHARYKLHTFILKRTETDHEQLLFQYFRYGWRGKDRFCE